MCKNRIKEYRKQKGMTMCELANIVGISTGYLCHLENGTRKNPSNIIMEKIAKVLNQSVSNIFFSHNND